MEDKRTSLFPRRKVKKEKRVKTKKGTSYLENP